MLQTSGTVLPLDDVRHVGCCVRRVAVHDAAVGVEVVVCAATLQCLYRLGDGCITCRSFPTVEIFVVLLIGHHGACTLDVVTERLDDTTILARESSLAKCNVRALHRDEHGVLTVTEVVVLNEGRATSGHAHAVLGYAVEVVVIDVHRHTTDTRMA